MVADIFEEFEPPSKKYLTALLCVKEMLALIPGRKFPELLKKSYLAEPMPDNPCGGFLFLIKLQRQTLDLHFCWKEVSIKENY